MNFSDFPVGNYERQWVKRENQVQQFSSFLLRCNKYSLFEDERKVILVEVNNKHGLTCLTFVLQLILIQ